MPGSKIKIITSLFFFSMFCFTLSSAHTEGSMVSILLKEKVKYEVYIVSGEVINNHIIVPVQLSAVLTDLAFFILNPGHGGVFSRPYTHKAILQIDEIFKDPDNKMKENIKNNKIGIIYRKKDNICKYKVSDKKLVVLFDVSIRNNFKDSCKFDCVISGDDMVCKTKNPGTGQIITEKIYLDDLRKYVDSVDY